MVSRRHHQERFRDGVTRKMSHSKVTLLALRFGIERTTMPPLGCLLLAAVLKKNGHDVEVIDAGKDTSLGPFSVRRLASLIASVQSNFIGFSIFHDALPLLIATIRSYPDCVRGKRVIIGGPGVTGVEIEVLAALEDVEAVVCGEGESAVLSLVNQCGKALGPIPGLYTRNAAGRPAGFGRSPRENMDKLPSPMWSAVDPKGYSQLPVSTTRGCPYDCSFCEVIATFGRKVSRRAKEKVAAEVSDGLKRLGSRSVRFVDDTFNVSRKHMRELVETITSQTGPIAFTAYARIDLLNEEDLSFLSQYGCARLFIGIDVFDSDEDERWSKGYSVDTIASKLWMVADYCAVSMSMMWGFPDESSSVFQQGIDLAWRAFESGPNGHIWPQYSLVSPSAATPLYARYSDRLVLDLDAPALPLGYSINEGARQESDGEAVVDVIRTMPRIGAAYYRFRTDSFGEKYDAVVGLKEAVERRVGQKAMDYFLETGT